MQRKELGGGAGLVPLFGFAKVHSVASRSAVSLLLCRASFLSAAKCDLLHSISLHVMLYITQVQEVEVTKQQIALWLAGFGLAVWATWVQLKEGRTCTIIKKVSTARSSPMNIY